MISSAVFSRYARSLADVVIEKRVESEVNRDLALYREIFLSTPELLDAFESPAIPRDAKGRLLAELTARYPVGPTAANFLQILLENNRIRYFHEILDLFTRTLEERKGIISAQVTSAVPLSDQEIAVLRNSLSGILGKSVNISMRTDAELLGGLVVQVGSTVYDGSIRKQLSEMRQRLMD